jgi:hypothetical protein
MQQLWAEMLLPEGLSENFARRAIKLRESNKTLTQGDADRDELQCWAHYSGKEISPQIAQMSADTKTHHGPAEECLRQKEKARSGRAGPEFLQLPYKYRSREISGCTVGAGI